MAPTTDWCILDKGGDHLVGRDVGEATLINGSSGSIVRGDV
jgi:hypothetical protein